MNREDMKLRVAEAIEKKRSELIEIGRALYAMPETGFREYRSALYTKEMLEKLGLSVQSGIAITGLKAKARGRSHERCVAVMGELDALNMPGHPHADAKTGAAHACGHHAQIAMILGTAMGLIESGVMDMLDGDVAFLAVPAEEVIELEYRKELANKGELVFFGGKQEFIRLGVFDDIDAVLAGHLSNTGPTSRFRHSASYNGVVNKIVEFTGKSAHAALAPEKAVSALQAAVNAINNINAMRETLPADQHPRIHYIITKGGDSPNIIPDDVRMEFGVRAATSEYMLALNDKVNAAIKAGSDAAGAQVSIRDIGVYLPTHLDKNLCKVFAESVSGLFGEERVIDASDLHRGSSTDVGDVAAVKPMAYVNFGGATGSPHTVEFDVADEGFAYVEAAKAMAVTIIDLLADGGSTLDDVKGKFAPVFSNKNEYFAYHDRFRSGEKIKPGVKT
jgi:amidohydrolase